MRLTWARLVQAAAFAALYTCFQTMPYQAAAQEFPLGRQISFVCAFPAGSGADIQVRFLAEKMSAIVGKTIIVDNKPGAGGNIAAQHVVQSNPDGYTVYMHSGSATAGNPHLFKNYAASSTSAKIMGAIYKQRAGLETVEINYRTSPDSMNDMLSGRLEFAAFDAAFALSQARAGRVRVRVLAVGSGERTKAMPNVPTMREQGVEMIHIGWWGAFVAAGTPEPIVQQWNALFAKLLSQKEVVDFHGVIGADIFTSTPKETHDLLVKTVDEWEELVRLAEFRRTDPLD